MQGMLIVTTVALCNTLSRELTGSQVSVETCTFYSSLIASTAHNNSSVFRLNLVRRPIKTSKVFSIFVKMDRSASFPFTTNYKHSTLNIRISLSMFAPLKAFLLD